MNPLSDIKESDEVANFFRKRGYKVSWDFSKRSGEYWYEIYKGDKPRDVLQIDMNVPLCDIVEDLKCVQEDREPTSKSNYKISHSAGINGAIAFIKEIDLNES